MSFPWVWISLIGLLGGIIAPAVVNARKTAKQMQEVNNLKQAACLLFADASEKGGRYPQTAAELDEFIKQKEIDGTTHLRDLFQKYSYIPNAEDCGIPGIPLLMTRGTRLTVVTNTSGGYVIFDSSSNATHRGFHAFYPNGSAQFQRIRGSSTTMTNFFTHSVSLTNLPIILNP